MAPLLIFCDADFVIQLFITSQTGLLRWLRSAYGLEPVIVPEVESELAWSAKFKDRFDADLKKVLASNVISLFDYSKPELQLSAFYPVAAAAAVASSAIIVSGAAYELRVGRGEAYSHAACVHLGMPLFSHDKNAIDTLRMNRLRTAAPVLRLFDLVTLAQRRGYLEIRVCDNIRKTLLSAKEWVPRAFVNSSYEKGAAGFDARLYDLDELSGEAQPCRKFNSPLYLQPT